MGDFSDGSDFLLIDQHNKRLTLQRDYGVHAPADGVSLPTLLVIEHEFLTR